MIEVSVHYPTYREVNNPSSDKVRFEFAKPHFPLLAWQTAWEGVTYDLPKGYGVAYHDWVCNRYLVAPMPFNIIIGAFISLWYWLRYGCAYFYHKHRGKTYRDAKREFDQRFDTSQRQMEIMRKQGVDEGIRKSSEYYNYLLDNFGKLNEEEALIKRKELLGY